MNKKNKEMSASVNEEVTGYETIKRIFAENFHRYKMSYALAIICMLIVSGTTALLVGSLKPVVNDVFQKLDTSAANNLALMFLLVFSVRGFAGFGQDVLLNRIGNNIVATYQARVFNHMMKLGIDFYGDTRSAYLVGQINQNLNGVRQMLNLIITVAARDLLTFVALIGVMIYMSPLLTLGSLVVLPIIGYVMSRYLRRIKQLARSQVNVNSKVTASMVEAAQGISIVKAFTMEKILKGKVDEDIVKAEKRANNIALINARIKPLTEVLGGIAIAGVIAFGGHNVIENGADPGAMLAFLVAALVAYDPGRRLAAFRVNLEKSLVNARMLYELLDTPPRQADKPDAKDLQLKNGKLTFEKVSFSYDGEDDILKNVSFIAEANKTTALVGPSGGGKTTIINLILRFYDLESGTIKVDGQDISTLKAASLRQNIALVSQSPVLFEGSILENLRYAKPDATMEEVIEATKLAQAHDFISETADGYDTAVGEMGANLSGGQRQRLSIARALLRDAKILLLDEATSALDNKSEKLVQRALENLTLNRTTIVVAHRLSTIRNADKIIVIDGGRVKEQGSHSKLIAKSNGIYANLNKIDSTSVS